MEIGVGNGLFLQYLSTQIPEVHRFIGIDINKEQIEDNLRRFSGSNLDFVHGDALSAFDLFGKDDTLVLACGTLQYFSLSELTDFLTMVRTRMENVAFGMVESTDLKLGEEFVSRPRVNTAYSHNYPRLFREAGFSIFEEAIRSQGGSQTVFLVATGARPVVN